MARRSPSRIYLHIFFSTNHVNSVELFAETDEQASPTRHSYFDSRHNIVVRKKEKKKEPVTDRVGFNEWSLFRD